MSFTEYRQTARGAWRAYYVTQHALMQWRGPNFKARVVRDPDDRIVERETEEGLRTFLEQQLWYWIGKGLSSEQAYRHWHEVWERDRSLASYMHGAAAPLPSTSVDQSTAAPRKPHG